MPSLGKPVVLMRYATKRTEALETDTMKLLRTNKELIKLETIRLLEDHTAYETVRKTDNPLEKGQASLQIKQAIYNWHESI